MSSRVEPARRPVFPRRRILGRPVDDVDPGQAIAWYAAALDGDRCRQVATVNPEFVMIADEDPDFARVLDAADLAIPDGVGLILAGRVRGQPIRSRVTGVDTVLALAELAADRGDPVFLLGAAPGVAEATAGVLRRRFPRLRIAGTHAGSPDPAEAPAIVDWINAAGARILFVAFGAPAQDKWIAANRDRLTTVRIAIGIGGSFDYLSGRVARAPAPIRRAGLEWLFRLIRQPWRWRRMLRLPVFAWRVLTEPKSAVEEA